MEQRIPHILALLVVSSMLLAAGGASRTSASARDSGNEIFEDLMIAYPTSATSGPLAAVATSTNSVDLTWTPASGAIGCIIEVSFGTGKGLLFAAHDASLTSDEDFYVLEGFPQAYRLTPTGSGETPAVMVATLQCQTLSLSNRNFEQPIP